MYLPAIRAELREWFAGRTPSVEFRDSSGGSDLTFPFTVTDEFLDDNVGVESAGKLSSMCVQQVKQDMFSVVKWGNVEHREPFMRAMTGYRSAGYKDEEVNVFVSRMGLTVQTSTKDNVVYSKLTIRAGWEPKNV